ncbi:MAG: hypothetical protein Q9165_000452 [Trypethelium subeluteriae]
MKFLTTLALGVTLAIQAITVIAGPSHNITLAFSPKDQTAVINRWIEGKISGVLAAFPKGLLANHTEILNSTLSLENQTKALLEAVHEGHVEYVAPMYNREKEIIDKAIETVQAGGQAPAELQRVIKDVLKKAKAFNNKMKAAHGAFKDPRLVHPRQWTEVVVEAGLAGLAASSKFIAPMVENPMTTVEAGTAVILGGGGIIAGGLTGGGLLGGGD